jgi:hypothetical protein
MRILAAVEGLPQAAEDATGAKNLAMRMLIILQRALAE